MMRRWEDGEDEGFHPTKLQGQQQPELSTNTFILKHINSTARHYIVSCALGAETNRNFGQHVKYDHDDDEMMMHWLNVKYTLEIGRGCMNMDCSLFSFTGQPAIQFSPLALPSTDNRIPYCRWWWSWVFINLNHHHAPSIWSTICWLMMRHKWLSIHHPLFARPPTTRGNKCNYSFRCPEHIVVGIWTEIYL